MNASTRKKRTRIPPAANERDPRGDDPTRASQVDRQPLELRRGGPNRQRRTGLPSTQQGFDLFGRNLLIEYLGVERDPRTRGDG
jgi:hypothetical protein